MRTLRQVLVVGFTLCVAPLFGAPKYSVSVRCAWPGVAAGHRLEPDLARGPKRVMRNGTAFLTVDAEESAQPETFGCWAMGSLPEIDDATAGSAAFTAAFDKKEKRLTLSSAAANVAITFGTGGGSDDPVAGKPVTVAATATANGVEVLKASIGVTPQQSSGLVFTTARAYEEWASQLSGGVYAAPQLVRMAGAEPAIRAALDAERVSGPAADSYLQLYRALFAFGSARSGAAAVPMLIRGDADTAALKVARKGRAPVNVGAAEVVVICPDSTCELQVTTK